MLHIADKTINNGEATPMIIVMPDANAGRRGYFNDPKNEWRYEDFFFEELIPHVDYGFRNHILKVFGSLREGPASHQLVGRVMAYQGDDG